VGGLQRLNREIEKRQAVEREFEHIQNWYRKERFAADPNLGDLITNYRTPGRKRASES
jgi:hypothetical protein